MLRRFHVKFQTGRCNFGADCPYKHESAPKGKRNGKKGKTRFRSQSPQDQSNKFVNSTIDAIGGVSVNGSIRPTCRRPLPPKLPTRPLVEARQSSRQEGRRYALEDTPAVLSVGVRFLKNDCDFVMRARSRADVKRPDVLFFPTELQCAPPAVSHHIFKVAVLTSAPIS